MHRDTDAVRVERPLFLVGRDPADERVEPRAPTYCGNDDCEYPPCAEARRMYARATRGRRYLRRAVVASALLLSAVLAWAFPWAMAALGFAVLLIAGVAAITLLMIPAAAFGKDVR